MIFLLIPEKFLLNIEPLKIATDFYKNFFQFRGGGNVPVFPPFQAPMTINKCQSKYGKMWVGLCIQKTFIQDISKILIFKIRQHFSSRGKRSRNSLFSNRVLRTNNQHKTKEKVQIEVRLRLPIFPSALKPSYSFKDSGFLMVQNIHESQQESCRLHCALR